MSIGYLLKEDGDYLLQENGDRFIINFSPAIAAFRHVLRLLYGNDKRNPGRFLDLAENDYEGHIFLRLNGFTPTAARQTLFYRESVGSDGKQRYHSKLENINLQITYDLRGTTAVDLDRIQAEIDRFVLDTGLYNEKRKGERVWFEYRFADGLADLPAPVFGQFSRYYEVIRALPQMPKSLHSGALTAGNIEQVILELECAPLVEGLEQLAGDGAGLASDDADVDLVYTPAGGIEVYNSQTIEGWIDHQAADYCFFEYFVSANSYIQLSYATGTGLVTLKYLQSSVVSAPTGALPSAHLGPLHVAFTNQLYGSAIVYINGTAIITVDYIHISNGGTLKLGGSVADVFTSYTNDLDGWRVFPVALTAAQVLQLYNNEVPVKNRYDLLGPPLYHKTLAGDGAYNAVDGVVSTAAKDHWGVIGGVSGTAPAKVRWSIAPPTSSPSRVYWLGVYISDAPLVANPDGTLFLDFIGTADVGASSSDAYQSSGAGTGTFNFTKTADGDAAAIPRGWFEVLARLKVTTATVVIQPAYLLGASTITVGDAVSVVTNASFLFRDLGDILIDYPSDDPTAEISLGITVARASSATVDVDFVQFLPFPNFRVEAEQASLTIDTGDRIIVDGRRAYALDASGNDSQLQRFEFQGEEVNLWPNKYNYVFLLQGEEGVVYTVTRTATVKAYVTPRWYAGGGAVA